MYINKERRTPSKRDVTRDKVYQSGTWKKVRTMVLDRDKNLCQECNRNGLIAVPGRTVDHIIGIKSGGSVFGLHNLEVLCDRCHASKSQGEKRK